MKTLSKSLLVDTCIGPYKLLMLLGEGGMGVVHLAEHTVSGEQVALKTLTAVKPEVVRSIQREIRALRRLRHPHIVRILDDGMTEDGVPWYAMEFLVGTPLDRVFRNAVTGALSMSRDEITLLETWQSTPRNLLHEVGTGFWTSQLRTDVDGNWIAITEDETGSATDKDWKPSDVEISKATSREKRRTYDNETVQHKLKLLVQVACALAYLHGEGLVHCDLKPENIVVAGVGRAVLVDFGLVATRSEVTLLSDVEDAGLSAGTALYLAPERIQGQDFDARLDLYALGCLLFEAITEQPAYHFPSRSKTFVAKLSGEIPRVDDFIDGVPKDLSDLTAQLMAHRPEERPSNALAVLARLQAAGIELAPELAVLPTPRPSIYSAALVGRAEALKTCRKMVNQSYAGETQFLMLRGESGVGKSRLAAEVVRYARQKKMERFVGQCNVVQGVNSEARRCPTLGPFVPILEAIAQRADTLELAQKWFGTHGMVLAQAIPSLFRLPGLERCPPVTPLHSQDTLLRLYQAVLYVLQSYLGERPAVLIFEDLQWADEVSLGALEWMRHILEEKRWLVVGTYRSDEVFDSLAEFVNSRGVEVINVERLQGTLSRSMLCSMLGTEYVPESLVKFVKRHAAGNPFFVTSCVRTAVDEGYLGLDSLGNWTFDETKGLSHAPMPTTLVQIVSRRLGLLDRETRSLLQAASVLGRKVDPELLKVVADEVSVKNALEILVAREILEPLDNTPDYRFVHDKLLEITYAELERNSERCAVFHRRAATHLNERRERGGVVDLSQLAWHLEASKQTESARLVYFEASRHAADGSNHLEAEANLMSGLRLTAESDVASMSAKVHFAIEVILRLGRLEEAEKWLTDVVESSSPHRFEHAHAEGLRGLGTIFVQTARMQEALPVFSQALNLFCALGDRRGEGKVLSNLGVLYSEQGEGEKALHYYQAALAIAREVGDKHIESSQLGNIGNIFLYRDSPENALAYYQAGLANAIELGDKRFEGVQLSNIGNVHLLQGHLEKALSYFLPALNRVSEVGDRRVEGVTSGNVGKIYAALGQVEEALSYYHSALSISREVVDRRLEAHWLVYLGRLHRMIGDIPEARQYQVDALNLLREVVHLESLGECLCEWGHLKIHAGELADKEWSEVRSMEPETSTERVTPLTKAMVWFERARMALSLGEKLYVGQCLKDFPEALRRRWTSLEE